MRDITHTNADLLLTSLSHKKAKVYIGMSGKTNTFEMDFSR